MEITGVIAQIFMTWWDKQIRILCERLRINILLYERYVDDINMVIVKVQKGTRFDGRELTRIQSDEEVDSELPDDRISMELFKSIAESIHQSIKLEVDVP